MIIKPLHPLIHNQHDGEGSREADPYDEQGVLQPDLK